MMMQRNLMVLLVAPLLGCNDECFVKGIGCSTAQAPFLSVVAGDRHSCARTQFETVCWGDDREGQLAAPFAQFGELAAAGAQTCGTSFGIKCWGTVAGAPAIMPEGTQFIGLTVGATHACGLQQFAPSECWGSNADGQLMVPQGFNFTEIAAGNGHSCARSYVGVAHCWGRNDQMQATPPPGQVHGLVASDGYSCALTPENLPICWGAAPMPPPAEAFVELVAGPRHLCGRRADHTVACWGDSGDGRSAAPAEKLVSIAAGGRHSCGVTDDGRIICWGSDEYGQSTPP